MIDQTGGQPTSYDIAMRFFRRLDMCQNSEERIAIQEQFARETEALWEASVGHQVDAMKARAAVENLADSIGTWCGACPVDMCKQFRQNVADGKTVRNREQCKAERIAFAYGGKENVPK